MRAYAQDGRLGRGQHLHLGVDESREEGHDGSSNEIMEGRDRNLFQGSTFEMQQLPRGRRIKERSMMLHDQAQRGKRERAKDCQKNQSTLT